MKKWYAVQIEPSYDRPNQYQKLKEILFSEKYGLSPEQVWISGDGLKKNVYMGYVFIQYEGDPVTFWENLSKERQICSETGIIEIPDSQMNKMITEDYPSRPYEDLMILDIVEIDDTPYRNMYGILLKELDDGRFEIGIKMFQGNRFIILSRSQFHRTRSLFEVWKFPKRS